MFPTRSENRNSIYNPTPSLHSLHNNLFLNHTVNHARSVFVVLYTPRFPGMLAGVYLAVTHFVPTGFLHKWIPLTHTHTFQSERESLSAVLLVACVHARLPSPPEHPPRPPINSITLTCGPLLFFVLCAGRARSAVSLNSLSLNISMHRLRLKILGWPHTTRMYFINSSNIKVEAYLFTPCGSYTQLSTCQHKHTNDDNMEQYGPDHTPRDLTCDAVRTTHAHHPTPPPLAYVCATSDHDTVR